MTKFMAAQIAELDAHNLLRGIAVGTVPLPLVGRG